MLVNRKTAPVLVLIWLLVNSVLGLIIAFFRGLQDTPNPFMALLVSVLITHIVGGSGALSGYLAGILLPNRGILKFGTMLLLSVAGTMLGLLVAAFFVKSINHWSGTFLSFWFNNSLPSGLLAILLCSTAAYIHRPNWFGESVEGKNVNRKPEVLPFFSEGRHYVLPFSEVIYLSARREGTEIFTTRTSLYGTIPLRRIQERLPEDRFVQIHRSHIISLDYISHLEYDIGGNYLIHLRDEEDTVLPVSRSRVQNLKFLLGMTGELPSLTEKGK